MHQGLLCGQTYLRQEAGLAVINFFADKQREVAESTYELARKDGVAKVDEVSPGKKTRDLMRKTYLFQRRKGDAKEVDPEHKHWTTDKSRLKIAVRKEVLGHVQRHASMASSLSSDCLHNTRSMSLCAQSSQWASC